MQQTVTDATLMNIVNQFDTNNTKSRQNDQFDPIKTLKKRPSETF